MTFRGGATAALPSVGLSEGYKLVHRLATHLQWNGGGELRRLTDALARTLGVAVAWKRTSD